MTMSLVKPVPPDQLPDNLTKIGCVEQYTKSKRGLFIPSTVVGRIVLGNGPAISHDEETNIVKSAFLCKFAEQGCLARIDRDFHHEDDATEFGGQSITIYLKTGKIIIFNMHQEPSVYVNGELVCVRPPNKIGEYVELGAVNDLAVETDEAKFVHVCKGQMKAHDIEVKILNVNKEEKLAMVGSSMNTPITLNNQVGLSGATTGGVMACLFKEFQISASLECLFETVSGMDFNLLKMVCYQIDMKKDCRFHGEFEVIKDLMAILPDSDAAKRECDKAIDKNGPAKTGGTSIKQLRENITEFKLSYEIMDDAVQVLLESKIMDDIHGRTRPRTG